MIDGARHTVMTSGVRGLRPLAQAFGFGVCAVVAAVIALGWIESMSREATKSIRPLIERGESVPGRILDRERSNSDEFVIEYQPDFELEPRTALIVDPHWRSAERGLRADSAAGSQRIEFCIDPLNPGQVAFAETLPVRVAAATAPYERWSKSAWLLMFCGALLSALTLLPMKRLANAHGVPLVHYLEDDQFEIAPASFGRYAGLISLLAGLFVTVVGASYFFKSSSDLASAERGVLVRGEVLRSFDEAEGENPANSFLVAYSMSEGGPRLEGSVRVLGGERAGRFHVDEGQTLDVTLRVDPLNPSRVRFEPAMEWELERAYTHRRVGLIVMLGSTLLTVAGAWLYVCCRRVMRRHAVPSRRVQRRRD